MADSSCGGVLGMTKQPPDSGFARNLRHLQEMHDDEISLLRVEISRLQAQLEKAVPCPAAAAREAGGLAGAAPLETLPSSPPEEDLHWLPDFAQGGLDRAPDQSSRISSTQSRVSRVLSDGSDHQISNPSVLVQLVENPRFDAFFAGLIVANFIIMAFEAQYACFRFGQRLNLHPDLQAGAAEHWPHAEVVFDVLQWVTGSLFTLEIGLKIVASKFECLRQPMNWLDLLVVGFWVASQSGCEVAENAQPARCLRFLKLLRMIRVARKVESFDALFLMTTAVQGSFSTLAWTMFVLVALLSLFALFMSQVLMITYFDDLSQPQEEKKELWLYFGTFTRALFSMFELTFGNYAPLARLLSEQIHSSFMAFTVLYKLTVGFTLLGVINGVFMQETFKAAALDDKIMIRQKAKAVAAHKTKMQKFFEMANIDGDRTLTMDEVGDVMEIPEARDWLGAMEFPVVPREDLHRLFAEIDSDGNNDVDLEELVKGVSRLRGAARSWDVIETKQLVREILDHLQASAVSSTDGQEPGREKDAQATEGRDLVQMHPADSQEECFPMLNAVPQRMEQ